MQTKPKTYIDEIVLLHSNSCSMLKRIEGLTDDGECPEDVKRDILKPIRSKIEWLRNTIENKFSGRIDVRRYQSQYNNRLLLNEIMQSASMLTVEQKKDIKMLIDSVMEGKILEIKVAEPVDEMF